MFNSSNLSKLSQIHCPFKQHKVCRRNHCPFIHSDTPPPVANSETKAAAAEQKPLISTTNGEENAASKSKVLNGIGATEEFRVAANNHSDEKAAAAAALRPKNCEEQHLDSISSKDIRFAIVNPHLPKKTRLLNELRSTSRSNSKLMKTTGDLIGQNSASNGRRIANLPKFDEGYRVSNHKLTKKGDISQVSRIKMRQALFNQFSRILKSTEDATNLAEDTEKEIFEVSKNRLRYIHAIDSLICKTRQNPPNNYLDTIINHKNTLRSSENNDIIHPTSNSVYRSKFGKYIWKMSVMELYIKLLDCVASFDELQDNGYPYKKFNCHSDDEILINETIYNWQLKRDLTLEEDEEICVRCHQRFIRVNSLDEVKDTDCCIYHPMNLTNKKYYGESNKLYRCCEQPSESPGCKTAVFHVFHQEIDLKSFTSLIQKPSNSSLQQQNTFGSSVAVADDLIIDETATIFALDCEMVYTVRGYELARVTLIDSMFHVVIDSLIKLTCDVVDYNSEFSGLTKSDIENATETLEDVRSKLNEILSKPKTPPIIVGHGLENDLISLGYHYNYIIDTALIESFSHNPYNNSENTKKNADSNPNNALKYVKMNNNNNNPTRDSSKSLFPNRHMKASLKKMAQIHLGKIIQADSSGHDSYEDACSALDIVYAIVMKKKQ